MKWIVLFLNCVFRGQSIQYFLLYNFTSMHAMSHRSDFSASSSRVNIEESTVCITIMLLLAVSQVILPSVLFPTTMSDSKSSNTSLLEVIISSKNECVIIHDLSERIYRIMFDACWASMNADSQRPITWNDSRHVSSCRFHLHCGIVETGSAGIICIVCHQVLHHPSEHGTSSMGKHLLARATFA